jgi:hypothetical protein
MFDAYDGFDVGGGNDDGVDGFHGDGVDEGPINGDSSDDEFNDGDFLSQLLRHTKAKLLIGSAKGLANFETVKISRGKCIEAIKGMSETLDRALFHT